MPPADKCGPERTAAPSGANQGLTGLWPPSSSSRRGSLPPFTGEGWKLAREFGRVRRRRDGRAGWEIDLGRHVRPRYLYSARGVPLRTKSMADAVLAAIQTQIARGMDPQAALDAFAPVSSEANRIDRYLADYLTEQEDRASRLEISPNHLRELRRWALLLVVGCVDLRDRRQGAGRLAALALA